MRNSLENLAMLIRPAPLGVLIKYLLGVRRQIVDTKSGRFWVDPVSNFGKRLISVNCYEPEVSAEVLKLAATAQSFVDVGANEGYFSIIVANARREKCRVIAIEPQSRLQEVIKKNLALNKIEHLVEHLRCAVSNEIGKKRFFLSPSVNTGSSGLARTTRYHVRTEETEVITLHQLMHQHGLQKIDLMKIDIEGYEYEAILGSKSVFESKLVNTLIIEIHSDLMLKRGIDSTDISRFLNECGYEMVYSFGAEVWRAT